MIAWNTVKEELSFSFSPQFLDEDSDVILVFLRSSCIVYITQMQYDVDSTILHHVLQQFVAIIQSSPKISYYADHIILSNLSLNDSI